MIRLLLILASAGLIATGLAYLADVEGSLDLTVGSYGFHMSIAVAAGLLLALVAALFLFFRLVAAIMRVPDMLGEWSRARKARAGYLALSHGLVAAAAGDAEEAKRFALQGEKLLGHAPLGLLLTAQAAQLESDEATQHTSYRAMLEHSETEFLGLRGLFLQAMRKGDEDAAIGFATRALELKPKAPWASHALFDLHVSRHEWDNAQAILRKQVRVRLIGGDVARRRRAVLLTAAALDAERALDNEGALTRALEAVGLAPALIPAAVLAARKLTLAGRTWKAQDLIEAAWTQNPHPDLAAAYAAIHPTDDGATRARRMQTLVQLNPTHIESRLLAAEQGILQHRWFDAKAALDPVIRAIPTARASVLMAEIAQAERGDTTSAQGWLARAARSPRDAQWRCGHCGFVMQDWTPLCPNCAAFDSLSWVAPRSESAEALPQAVSDTAVLAPLIEARPATPAGPPTLLARTREERPQSLDHPPDDPGVLAGDAGYEEDETEAFGGYGQSEAPAEEKPQLPGPPRP
jgi:HemY protein